MGNIKDFLPPRRGKIAQGYYSCSHPEKYVGDLTKIIFRSSWEFKFMRWCDNTPAVLKFSAEPICIPYVDLVDKRVHQYYIDFWAEMLNPDGTSAKHLIEIKPEREAIMPKPPLRQTPKSLENHIAQVKRVLKNLSKFKAAKAYSAQNGMKFSVLRLNRTTEEFEFVKWENDATNGF